jgi:ABC-type nickel/cobalt efflux system permease component RcnA
MKKFPFWGIKTGYLMSNKKKIQVMKKSIYIFILLITFLLAGNAHSQPSELNQQSEKNHGHNSHGKRGGHHKGIRLFHRHHYHGKSANSKDHSRSHHEKKGRGDKETTDKK